ncbi:MAG: NAD-dependent epimerase/dehydratase family protein [Bacteroidaceae bacterium]|nr:NAD-dependent epimerase/dehydratase family protein [Bacteroidaceae bacterium]
MKTILVTGAAGFIGSNLVKKLCASSADDIIVGIDNMNDYYDVRLKEQRLEELLQYPTFRFVKGNIADKLLISDIFVQYRPQIVVNLAAQAGVRYSITNPDAYIESNIIGFYNILEACRHNNVEHLVYASSSSVYGNNEKVPYSTDDKVDNPVSLYAATKKSNELMAHAYSKLYNIPSTGLRFFTVYGPAGRPDMAYFGFTNKLVKGEKIQIFNYGNCKRDFTYVDDIVEGVYRVMMKAPKASPQPSPKRKGVHAADPLMYDLLKTYAEENRKNPTEAESVLWEALKAKGIGAKFRRQHIIGDFIVDFYCNEANLVIELDGGYHNKPTQMKSDAERTAALKAMGYTELRFKNEEVICNIDAVLKTIKTFTNVKSFPSGEDLGEASVPYKIYNIGNNSPENLLDFVTILQEELLRAGVLPQDYDFESHKELVPMQPGDVPVTYADTSALEADFGFKPSTSLREGLRKFAEWYVGYYNN